MKPYYLKSTYCVTLAFSFKQFTLTSTKAFPEKWLTFFIFTVDCTSKNQLQHSAKFNFVIKFG